METREYRNIRTGRISLVRVGSVDDRRLAVQPDRFEVILPDETPGEAAQVDGDEEE